MKKVYNPKVIGRLGEKEESYLKERIKRAGSGTTQDETKLVGKKPVAKNATMRRGTFTVDKKSTKPILRDETVTVMGRRI